MSKKTATKKKAKSAGIQDLPLKSPNLAGADTVVGGGTRKPAADPKPTESISFNFTKIETG